MKRDLKTSTLAIICVLCTAAVSGAYGASSVRSLGGAGTYTSASSAAAAGSGSTSSTASVRGGSVRVNPTSGVSGTSTTIEAGTTTSGRVATTPRLSIGHYLGGGTSVSGGSSLRPQTPGSSGGGSSTGGGGSMDPDIASELRQEVDQLHRDMEDLRDADDTITDALLDKQDKIYPGEDGYIVIDDMTNEIFVDVDALEGALDLVAGQDGREVELGSNDTDLLWRYSGDGDNDWRVLISKSEITGPQGEKGEPGEAADLEAYSTTEEMNLAISNAITNLANTYVSQTDFQKLEREVAAKANTVDVNAQLGTKANVADVYTKSQVYNKTEIDGMIDQGVSGDVSAALDAKADKTYVDNQLATKADKSELSNYATVGSVTALDTELDEINDLVTDTALGVANVTSALGNKADKSALDSKLDASTAASTYEVLTNKADTINAGNQTSTDAYPSIKAVVEWTGEQISGLGETGIPVNPDNITPGSITGDKLEDGTITGDKIADDTITTDNIADGTITSGDLDTALNAEIDGKEDKSNKIQEITAESTSDQYPSAVAVRTALSSKADASALDAIEESVTNVTNQYEMINETVTELGDTINNEDTGLAAQVKDAVDAASAAQTAAEEAKNTATGAQGAVDVLEGVVGNEESGLVKDVNDLGTTVGTLETTVSGLDTELDSKLDAGTAANTYEVLANKVGTITADNQSSSDEYPTVGAITQWTNTKINELADSGIPVNPDSIGEGAIDTINIANGAVTADKLSNELKAEIDGKADEADLGALAKKDQIMNDDVADDAAIAKEKLALDVQAALDKAADAVSMAGASENSVLGTDGEGNPVWYEIAM